MWRIVIDIFFIVISVWLIMKCFTRPKWLYVKLKKGDSIQKTIDEYSHPKTHLIISCYPDIYKEVLVMKSEVNILGNGAKLKIDINDFGEDVTAITMHNNAYCKVENLDVEFVNGYGKGGWRYCEEYFK